MSYTPVRWGSMSIKIELMGTKVLDGGGTISASEFEATDILLFHREAAPRIIVVGVGSKASPERGANTSKERGTIAPCYLTTRLLTCLSSTKKTSSWISSIGGTYMGDSSMSMREILLTLCLRIKGQLSLERLSSREECGQKEHDCKETWNMAG